MSQATVLILTGVISFLSVLLSICSIGFLWIVFEKAGRKAWESIIPVWNIYVSFKIAGKTSYFWVLVLLPIIWVIYFIIMGFSAGNESLFIASSIISWILGGCSLILPLIAWLELPYGITKKFGKSNWFYLGMIFLTPIFMGILAFGDAKYEEKEFEKKYCFKKFFLIAAGIALLYGIGDAGMNYFANEGLGMLENISNNKVSKNIIVKKNKCYGENGKLNANPDKDKEGNIVNCYNDKGLQHGKWLGYNGYGEPILEENYIDGIQNGMEIWTWPENGKLRYKVNVIDGKREGEGRSYYKDGGLEFIENYKNGVLEGEKEYYFNSGKVKRRENLEHGKVVGASNFFEKNDVEEIEVYINGEKKGTTYHYPDGYFEE